MSRPRTQAERLAVTRATLLREARLIFAASGYDAAATEEIVQRAKVTRGALYYHFKDKRAVFEAIVEEVASEIAAAVDERAAPAVDPLQALIEGTRAFLDACLDPAVRRIYLIDAPAVLGWHRWRDIDAPHGVRTLREGVAAVLAARPDPALGVEPITFLLSGAFNEAALWVAEAKDEKAARREMDRTLVQLLERLFRPAAAPARPPRARARA
ncbi:MAG: TetR family transcriptional regulator [Reyranella sp.]|uniref:TetR family transcriptional regulator n=1 Tax=Reyranella sp. TaxID=1929291 RepID=UPI001228E982|nr:TetR/AcrR family transcriptional regulator [Reyranella sp.]TAJ91297.1 MAG: TetR family transcriptional regulator [Reyranella sp.]